MKVKAADLDKITKRVRRREREDIVKWSRFGGKKFEGNPLQISK
jgi:hypothetical protein